MPLFLKSLELRHIVTAAVLLAMASAASRFLNLTIKRTLERQRARGTLLPETATQLALTRRVGNFVIWFAALGFSLTQFPELRVLSAGLPGPAGTSRLLLAGSARPPPRSTL